MKINFLENYNLKIGEIVFIQIIGVYYEELLPSPSLSTCRDSGIKTTIKISSEKGL